MEDALLSRSSLEERTTSSAGGTVIEITESGIENIGH